MSSISYVDDFSKNEYDDELECISHRRCEVILVDQVSLKINLSEW